MDPALAPLALTEWLHPAAWLELFGAFATAGVLAIIFAETGLLFGCLLPGDSLLFAAGVLTAAGATGDPGSRPLSLTWLMIGGPIAAVLGAQFGHWLGARYGRRLFDRPDSRVFRREWAERAEHHFLRFGPGRAVVLARFVPIVRTFLNPFAGMVGMSPRRFLVWNAVGALLWTESLFLAGHFLGATLPGIERFVLPGVAVVVLVCLLPLAREMVRGRPRSGNGTNKNASVESRPSLSSDSYR